jgi:eukaryotic-like serine/threonine-protein kinase
VDRYASVQQLAEDIARHLSGLPITARRAGRWERARKFATRHRVPVVSAALVVMSLLTGLGAAATQARSAARERDVARHEGGRAEQITAFLIDLFETADPMDAAVGRGDTLRVRTVLDRGADRIRRDLADRPVLQQELLATMGRIYTNLGAFDAAERVLGEALAAGAADADPRTHAVRVSLLARIALERGQFPRADSLFDIAVKSLDALGGARDSLYVAVTTEHGLIRSYLGEYESALELTELALTLAQANDLASGPLGSRVLNNLATVRYDMGEYAVAEPLYRQSLEIEQSYRPARHPSIASLLNNLAASIHYQGRYEQAEPLYLEAIAVARDGLGERHATVGDYLQNLGTLYADQQRLGEAGPLYEEAAEIYEAAFGRRSPRTAMLLRNVALNHYESGAYNEAVLLLREIELSLRDELGADHLYTVAVSAALGRVLTITGEHEEAFTRLNDCIAAYEGMLPEGHFLLETARRDLGVWYARNQQFDLAEPLLLSSHAALAANRGHDSILAVEARAHLRALYEAQGMTERAAEFAP